MIPVMNINLIFLGDRFVTVNGEYANGFELI